MCDITTDVGALAADGPGVHAGRGRGVVVDVGCTRLMSLAKRLTALSTPGIGATPMGQAASAMPWSARANRQAMAMKAK